MELSEVRSSCPYCGAPLSLLVDDSDLGVEYVEDCQVCCQPMVVQSSPGLDGQVEVRLRREDE